MNDFQSPVYAVRRVPIDKVQSNLYNPNSVAPMEMALLELSIWEDGYTQPVVAYYDQEQDKYIVVDGFHRYLTLKNSQRIFDRENGMLPVVVIDKDISNRMASTIRHNRARGKHQVESMSEIVIELKRRNWSEEKIGKNLGMEPDEILRLCQLSGIAELFQDQEFSQSWDIDDLEEDFVPLVDGEA